MHFTMNKHEKKQFQRSTVALAILAMLLEEPMHPYRMQQLLKERGKYDVVNVRQRASIYQTIDRLLRHSLIEIIETKKEEGRPDRTIYGITEEGRKTASDWMKAMLAVPAQEFPEFPAALSFMPILIPEEALMAMEKRVKAIKGILADIDAQLQDARQNLPRVVLLDLEFKQAVYMAEARWIESLIEDIREKNVNWSYEWLLEMGKKLHNIQE